MQPEIDLDEAVHQAISAAMREPEKYRSTAPGLFLTPEKRRDQVAKIARVIAERGPYSKAVKVNQPVVHELPCECGCGKQIIGAMTKKYATPECKERVRAKRNSGKRELSIAEMEKLHCL